MVDVDPPNVIFPLNWKCNVVRISDVHSDCTKVFEKNGARRVHRVAICGVKRVLDLRFVRDGMFPFRICVVVVEFPFGYNCCGPFFELHGARVASRHFVVHPRSTRSVRIVGSSFMCSMVFGSHHHNFCLLNFDGVGRFEIEKKFWNNVYNI